MWKKYTYRDAKYTLYDKVVCVDISSNYAIR